ncbi:hypothetical protein JCM1841_002738 [Sporobolomyces salmonicolor]
MAARLSRSLQSISSFVPFLALDDSAASSSSYSAVPLSAAASAPTSGKSSPRLETVDDDEKQLPHLSTLVSPLHHRRHPLVALWLVVSPIIVLALAVTAYAGRRPKPDDGILNPYACEAKSEWSSLKQVCTNGTGADDLARYDLPLDRHLTQAQCDDVYPGLYLEVERMRDFWKARGGVTQKDLDDAEEKGQARAMIYNNRLYVKSYSREQQGTRTKATLASINEALITSLEPLPDVEFVIQTGDNGLPAGAPWALGRKEDEEQLTLMPDYGFFSWPEPGVNSFLEVADNCREYESKLPWSQKINQLFWLGAFMVDVRKELWEVAHRYKWSAIEDLDWQDREMVNSKLLTPEQHCDYKFLAHVEGFAYSGRLKYLTQCRSVIIAHKMQYIQHFHHLFNADPSSPDQNLVISPGHNFDELPGVMADLLVDDVKAQRIAENSYAFWRHWLSPSSINCYWRRLIQQWAEVQAFEPVLTRKLTSYNSFILMGQVHWEPF